VLLPEVPGKSCFSTARDCPLMVITAWSFSAFNLANLAGVNVSPLTNAENISPSSPALSLVLIRASIECPISSIIEAAIR
jgi:hypothetical protein